MRVVVAPDSFKGTLTAVAAAEAIARGLSSARPDLDIVCKPMADGGEGTMDTVLAAGGGERVCVATTDALGRPITASYGALPDGRALIELAAASGLPMLAYSERTPAHALSASTYGTGVLIAHALGHGATGILLALGGSATTDGGYGLLAALGARFRDRARRALDGRDTGTIDRVASIDLNTPLLGRLREVPVQIAVDVTNPLCGPAGAAAVYGRQKGLDEQSIARRDRELAAFAQTVARAAAEFNRRASNWRELAKALQTQAGLGAAGGAALPLTALAGASLLAGAKVVADAVGLAQAVATADLVITGEGCSDAQSAQGKVPALVAQLAREAGVPCALLSGALRDGYEALLAQGVTAVRATSPSGASEAEIAQFGAEWLAQTATRFATSRDFPSRA